MYMNIKELKTGLGALGLSKNESSVYLSLLSKGLSQAGPLVKETRLHRMLVYEALNRLADMGLVTIVHKKNIRIFHASDPTVLTHRMHELANLSQAVVHALHSLQKRSDVVSVRTLIGREGFITNLQEVVESAARQKDNTLYIIGGARDSDFYDAIGDWYDDYINLLKKHRVQKRLLAPTSFSDIFKKKFVQEKGTELRTLPHGLSSPTYTRITEEMVTIELYYPSIVIIQIRNKAVAQSYIDSFELLWKQAANKRTKQSPFDNTIRNR